MRRNPKFFALLSLLGLLYSCSSQKTASAPSHRRSTVVAKAANQRQAAPDFTLMDASGSKVKLTSLRGKVVLLNFWATWCGPCVVEIPWFKEFEQNYKSKGFEVLGVSMDEDGWAAIKPFVAERQLNYRILLGDDSVGQLYGGLESLPTTFVIDREGKFAFAPHVGLIGKNEYVDEIETLLDEKPASVSLLAGHPAVGMLLGPAK